MPKDQKIVITGCAGSIGSELTRQLAHDYSIYGIDINETGFFDMVEELGIQGRVGDIADPNVFDDIFNVGYIFHAAARKHVTPMEWNPEEAIHTNINGTLNVIRFAKRAKAKLIFISTDKAVNPQSVMGCSKRMGEIMVKNAGGISVRFGNVLGSQGSVIPIWQKQIDQGRPITVTDERMERYFMTIEEACSLVIQAAETGLPGDIVVLDMGKPVRILDIAKKIVAESRTDTEIVFTGMKPGEKLSELLMSPYEEEHSIKEGRFTYIR